MIKRALYCTSLLLLTSICLAQEKPNVLFILADDLGYGDISYNNDAPEWFRHTPNIDRICEQGIYFSNFSVHHVCSPTRAGLLTGMHYSKVGSGSETGGTLHNDIPNVAKDFKANGYVTGAFGKWHNSFPNFPADGNGASVSRVGDIDSSNLIFEKKDSKEWGEGVNAYGFDRWTGYYNGGGDYFNRYVNAHHEKDWWIDKYYRPDVDGYTTDLIGEAAVNFIEANKDNSFYCYVPMEAVHAPYHAKRSDLMELCSHFPGEWDYVKDIVSPTTGRRISEVSELRCSPGAEFDHTAIDTTGHFIRLIYSAMIYSMDKTIGNMLAKLEEHSLDSNTIVFFTSDNGATGSGSNGTFQGFKHSLWEGGIHVPAAMWWPGKIDHVSLDNYAEGDNVYSGYLQYIDFYPTMMALTNSTITAGDLDGRDVSEGILNRTDVRAEHESPYFGINSQWGVVKSGKWKLHYNEVKPGQVLQLYDLDNDPEELNNMAEAESQVTEDLKKLYNDWVSENNYSFSYLPVPEERMTARTPSPEGEVLEIEAWQADSLVAPLFVRFANFSNGGEDAGDHIEFDIYVPEDTENDSGFHFSPGGGVRPYYIDNRAVTQDSMNLNAYRWPRNQWIKVAVGYGNHAPIGGYANYVCFVRTLAGYTHFYMDNMIVRHKDGSTETIWKSENDFNNLEYRYQDVKYKNFNDLKKIDGFPFTEIKIQSASELDISYLALKDTLHDIHLESTKIILLDGIFEVINNPGSSVIVSLVDWTNKDILEVVYKENTKELFIGRKGNEGGESIVTVSGQYNEQSLVTSFKVFIDPLYTLQLKQSIDSVVLDSVKSIPLDDVFEIVDHPDEIFEISVDGWTNQALLTVEIDTSGKRILLERSGSQGGESTVRIIATYQDQTVSTDFHVEITEISSTSNESGEIANSRLYPNPANGIVYIDTQLEIEEVYICNILGNRFNIHLEKNTMNTSQFKEGLYFLHLMSKNRTEVIRLIIKR